ALPGACPPLPLQLGRLPVAPRRAHARWAIASALLRHDRDQLRYRPGSCPRSASLRRRLVARLRWPGYLSLRPGTFLLPPRGFTPGPGACLLNHLPVAYTTPTRPGPKRRTNHSTSQLELVALLRGVAQLGNALRTGRIGCGFECR